MPRQPPQACSRHLASQDAIWQHVVWQGTESATAVLAIAQSARMMGVRRANMEVLGFLRLA
ncbi:hypothetical protein PAXINDRAFT_166474 [Paxillus involutus ATCC 200175]|nr:hypothetical protein PAXINDRAFT_166474 [Paxillus involutus ATCC 200175]